MVKNEAGEFYDLNLTICFLTSEKHSFGVHTDKSPKICTHVEHIFLYNAGLLLNIDVAVPFLKRKNIAKNCVSIQCTPHCQGVSVSPTNQMPAFILIDSPQYPTRATRRQWLANVPHKWGTSQNGHTPKRPQPERLHWVGSLPERPHYFGRNGHTALVKTAT